MAAPAHTVTLTRQEIEILAELKRRAPWDPLDELFPSQRRFIEDKSRFKAALCGRRAGKTTAVVHWAIKIAMAGGRVAFIALTLGSARELFWKPFKEIKEKKQIKCHLNETLLEITFPGGGEIKLRGADKPKEIEKIRGVPHDLVAIDEAAYIGDFLEKLVEEVIEPSLFDRRGSVVLVCTPSAGMVGMFYDVTRPELEERKKGWSVHEWSMADNPHIGDVPAELAAIKERRAWTDQTPKYIREYLGRWCRSDEDFVYNFAEKRNVYRPDGAPDAKHGLPVGYDWQFILSVDIGFRDQTAFVVSAFAQNCPDWFIVEAFGKSEMIPSDVAALMIQLRDKYDTHKIVMDCGALGLSIAEEFRARYELQIQAADKKEKLAAIELMNSDMLNGRVKVPAGSPVIAQWQTLQFDENGLEDPRCKNDLADAALYGWRYAKHYLPAEGVKPAETLDSQMAAYWQKQAQNIETAKSREWWEGRDDPFKESSYDDFG